MEGFNFDHEVEFEDITLAAGTISSPVLRPLNLERQPETGEATTKKKKKKERKRTAEVWTKGWFKAVNSKEAVCSFCPAKLSYELGTSNLLAHMRARHQDETIARDKNGVAYPPVSQQELDMDLVLMIVMDDRPLSFGESKRYRRLATKLNPNWKVPSTRTVVRLLTRLHREMEGEVKKVIQNTRHYAITVDGWSTFTHTGFLALTYHAIPKCADFNAQWKLKSFLLELCEVTQESEDADSIAKSIDDILTRWSLKKENCVMATTDGAPVMPLAIRKLGLPWMHCAAHGVNLAVEKGFEVKEAEAVLTAVRSCVSYFDKHPKHMRVLRKKQGVLENQPGLSLVKDCETRWNSRLHLIDRYSVLKESIAASLTHLGIHRLPTPNYDHLNQMMEPLLSMQWMSVLFSGDSQPLFGLIMSSMYVATNVRLAQKPGDSPFLVDFKNALKTRLQEWWGNVSWQTSKTMLLAMLFDPRTKQFSFLDDEPRLKQTLFELAKGFAVEDLEALATTATPSPFPQRPSPATCLSMRATDSAFRFYQGTPLARSLENKPYLREWSDYLGEPEMPLLSQHEAPPQPEVEIDDAADDYLYDIECEEDEPPKLNDPMTWWSTRDAKYRNYIAPLARKYLCCMPSSVPSERVFSKSGWILNKRRASLLNNNLSLLTFLSVNLSRLDDDELDHVLSVASCHPKRKASSMRS